MLSSQQMQGLCITQLKSTFNKVYSTCELRFMESQGCFSRIGEILGTGDFRRCFPVTNQYLETYLEVVKYRSVVFPKAEHFVPFNIIPKFWYRARKLKINTVPENTIYVTLEEEVKLYLTLLYYFMSVDDHETYKRLFSYLGRKVVCLGFGTLREILNVNGMLPERVVSEYVRYWSAHNKMSRRDLSGSH